MQLYYSREDRINDICEDADRVQYQDPVEDEKAALDPLYATGESVDMLETCVEDYFDAIEGGDPAVIRHKRSQLAYEWAAAQLALSKVAWVLRIDGNDAFQRLVNAIKTQSTADMEGL